MATPTYESALELAQRLAPEDQKRLIEALEDAAVTAERELKTGEEQARPNQEKQARLEAWFASSDELAHRVSAAWKDSITALDAVKEQRRDL